MAKETGKKKKKKKDKKGKGEASTPALAAKPVEQAQAAPGKKRSKVAKAVTGARKAAENLAENPLIAEVVAAALVATAAAIKDPKKARQMAAAAGTELEEASGKVAGKSDLFWNMALDIARRSLEALRTEDEGDPGPAPKAKTKT